MSLAGLTLAGAACGEGLSPTGPSAVVAGAPASAIPVAAGGGGVLAPAPGSPAAEAEPETVSGSVSDPEPEAPESDETSASDTTPEAEPAPESPSASDPDPEPAPVPDLEPVPDPEPAPAPDPEPAPVPDPEPAPAPDPEPQPVPVPEPDPPSDPPPAPTGLGITFVVSSGTSELQLRWNSIPGASYVVELGRSPGAADFGRFNVSATAFSYRELPPGRVFARVMALDNGVLGPPSSDVSDWFFDFRDYIEAIFLGTGRLAPTDGNNGCSATGWVRGFGPGTTVPMFVSTTVSPDKLTAIQRTANQVSSATSGSLRVNLSQTTDPNPIPGDGQATSTTLENASAQGCASDAGCTIHVFMSNASPGLYRSSRAVQPSNQTPAAYAHDAVGHGVVGLCHVDGNLIGGAEHSLMSAGPGVFSGDIASSLTTYDLEATRALYRAGLSAGARRPDLVGAGLINP